MQTLYIRRLKKPQQQAESEETWCLASKQQVRGGLLGNIQSTAEVNQSTASVFKVLHRIFKVLQEQIKVLQV